MHIKKKQKEIFLINPRDRMEKAMDNDKVVNINTKLGNPAFCPFRGIIAALLRSDIVSVEQADSLSKCRIDCMLFEEEEGRCQLGR